jgi:two-component system sensor histidine kinase KdpD
VPPAERDNIFEKFYRLKHGHGEAGAGLGLAICRGFVEAHGGRIWVEEREGGGARFRFTLPIEGALPAEKLDAQSEVSEEPRHGESR